MEYSYFNQIEESEKFMWNGNIVTFSKEYIVDNNIDYSIPFKFNGTLMRPVKIENGFIVCRVFENINKQ